MTNPYGDDPTRAYGREQEYPSYGNQPQYAGNTGHSAGQQRPEQQPKVDNGPFFAGIGATALVAAIAGWVVTAILQAVYNRFEWGTVWAYGLVDPWTAAFTGALAAVLSGALMWLLVQGVPSPLTFYSWIAALIVVAVVALPFLAAQSWQAALGAGIVHGFLGAVIITLTDVVAGRTVHE
ncbi:hypothetical protein G4H71_21415 [Rhodococcus triatomae]|uniref:Uncharacterized protein n=1 Tax=Rhodococcus triatomae TaxID=300028 RepID=A0A1G8K4S5_9NOCA|nr:hypothetical protein [Rhodococcus triatomae]QNG18824.1 hypothetical protein G4H72_08960 [Rhodococcus triatomae]QNG25265.1 hypothetical protein G4H71_21415 [Rhodococcus triatomae]SDI38431.1 hypothetical protein SAMN05444695_10724 [Rhodococcus triatomae]